MAIKSRSKLDSITTPVGIAKYPWVNIPSTKFVEGGEYSCSLVLTKEEGEVIVKQLKPIFEEAILEKSEELGKKAKSYELPIQLEGDSYILKAKLKPVN